MSYLPDPAPVGPWDDDDQHVEANVPGVLFDDGPQEVGKLWVVCDGVGEAQLTLYDRRWLVNGFGYTRPEG